MCLKVKPRHGIVGLRLQEGSLDAAFLSRQKPWHAATIHQVGDEGCDEHGFARPRKPGDTEPDHGFKQRARHGVAHRLDTA